jgi:hypothetical protein
MKVPFFLSLPVCTGLGRNLLPSGPVVPASPSQFEEGASDEDDVDNY